MGNVPQSYFDFLMYYAPFFYVIPTAMTADPPSGQKNVTVADGMKFQANYPVKILDSAHSEWNEVLSVAGNIVTMKNNLANTYYVEKGGSVEGPDPGFGRGAFASAFTVEFLYEAYNAPQYASLQSTIFAKIVTLADWLLTQQCTDNSKLAYGGFKSAETSTSYYANDAGRAIPALLKAYDLTNDTDYLAAAKLAGLTFLYQMQHAPAVQGVHDRYYGGFAQFVSINNDWSGRIQVEELYSLIGLKMLADTYDVINASVYNQMMDDAVGFLRGGFEKLWLYFDPLPYGSGSWSRVGVSNNEIYDDPISYALLGLYVYEGWSLSCQRVYDFVQSIKASGQYPAYVPDVCWPGYIDVVTRFPACTYYDAVTIGILWKIRKERDPPAYKMAYDVTAKYSIEFLNWGPQFPDYSSISPQRAMANVSWIARMFLNYEEPRTQFTRMLSGKGEAVLLYPVRQAVDVTSYADPFDMQAIVSPMKAEQVIIEPGYYLDDFLAFYTFLPIRSHDKIRRQGQEYEVLTVTPFTGFNKRLYFKSVARRLLTN